MASHLYEYILGETARSCDMASQKTILHIALLRKKDAAFVKRSDGTWRYSIVTKRVDGYNGYIEFTVNSALSIKRFRRDHWSEYICLIQDPSREVCDTPQSILNTPQQELQSCTLLRSSNFSIETTQIDSDIECDQEPIRASNENESFPSEVCNKPRRQKRNSFTFKKHRSNNLEKVDVPYCGDDYVINVHRSSRKSKRRNPNMFKKSTNIALKDRGQNEKMKPSQMISSCVGDVRSLFEKVIGDTTEKATNPPEIPTEFHLDDSVDGDAPGFVFSNRAADPNQ